ncbi:hypothetical protein OKW26_000467 [Paraburkholderia sp. 32]
MKVALFGSLQSGCADLIEQRNHGGFTFHVCLDSDCFAARRNDLVDDRLHVRCAVIGDYDPCASLGQYRGDIDAGIASLVSHDSDFSADAEWPLKQGCGHRVISRGLRVVFYEF